MRVISFQEDDQKIIIRPEKISIFVEVIANYLAKLIKLQLFVKSVFFSNKFNYTVLYILYPMTSFLLQNLVTFISNVRKTMPQVLS